jgi:hypothetical protein
MPMQADNINSFVFIVNLKARLAFFNISNHLFVTGAKVRQTSQTFLQIIDKDDVRQRILRLLSNIFTFI